MAFKNKLKNSKLNEWRKIVCVRLKPINKCFQKQTKNKETTYLYTNWKILINDRFCSMLPIILHPSNRYSHKFFIFF